MGLNKMVLGTVVAMGLAFSVNLGDTWQQVKNELGNKCKVINYGEQLTQLNYGAAKRIWIENGHVISIGAYTTYPTIEAYSTAWAEIATGDAFTLADGLKVIVNDKSYTTLDDENMAISQTILSPAKLKEAIERIKLFQ